MRSTILLVAAGFASVAFAQTKCSDDKATIALGQCLGRVMEANDDCTSNECQCEFLKQNRDCWQQECPDALAGTDFNRSVDYYCSLNQDGDSATSTASGSSSEPTSAGTSVVAPVSALVMAIVVSLGML